MQLGGPTGREPILRCEHFKLWLDPRVVQWLHADPYSKDIAGREGRIQHQESIAKEERPSKHEKEGGHWRGAAHYPLV